MNLQKLFNIQRQLDNRIVKEHGLEGQDLLDKKILALQVELGELANEQRSWKFWSKNQNPRRVAYFIKNDFDELFEVDKETFDICYSEEERNDPKCNYEQGSDWDIKYPLLEEYVDCLHFILSIGLDIGVKPFKPNKLITFTNDVTGQFNAVFKLVSGWDKVILLIDHNPYYVLVNNFFNLGEMLGFTAEQIEHAYLDKNKINHERQANGY